MLTLTLVLFQTCCGAAVGRVGDVINGNKTEYASFTLHLKLQLKHKDA